MMQKILIIEDDPGLLLPLQLLLEQSDIAYDCAQNAHTAIKACASSSYGLILLDLLLPGMNGAEWLENMHATWKTSPPFIIIMTNIDDDSMRERCMRAGANQFLLKSGTDLSTLRTIILEHL